MRTFVVFSSAYMGEGPDAEMVKAKDIRDLLEKIGFINERSTCKCCEGTLNNAALVQFLHDTNGDGQPFHTIKEIITELDGLRLINPPELEENEDG